MIEKYDNQTFNQVKEAFGYINEIPTPIGIIDLEKNYIVYANDLLSEILSCKNFPIAINQISSFDFSSFIKEIEITKNNVICTTTEMVKMFSLEEKPINADINIKLSNKVKSNLAVMSMNIKVCNEPICLEINQEQLPKERQTIFECGSENVIRTIVEELPLLYYVYDIITSEIIHLNEYTKNIFNSLSNDEITKRIVINNINDNDFVCYEKMINGMYFKTTEVSSFFKDNRVVKIGLGVNITEEKKKKALLTVTTDKLTGILNKMTGLNRLQECTDKAKSYDEKVALCYFDIDKISFVNECFGTEEGDRYIKRVVSTVKKVIRRSDIFARVGGDEFIVVLYNCPLLTAERIMKSINTTLIEGDDESEDYNSSITYSVIEIDKTTDLNAEQLLEKAENQMLKLNFDENNK